MFTLDIDDFDKLINAIEINKPEDAWWRGHQSTLLLQLNEIRDEAMSIAWFQGQVPLISINDKISKQINEFKEYLCRA
ncbi:hypothetical protein CPTAKMNP4_017 [Salmonella phage vB_SenM-AKM_NP4]|uniref:Uncharacterized protein n=2 Tax=Gelderlandvirus TaxID=1913653 RepID=M1HDG1_BPS16|nr:hypothetical protein I133_gp254 [Salmonella phage vB_SenM-S16]YP_009126221.1 hypothetical protein STP4a_012 [Salmonella phage STP4-a]UFK27140.1 hypothetical protein LG358_00119 [Escherichia phage UoN_LG358_1]WDR21683.1 hypothetical protein PJM34_0015 [Salmonella phage vB_SenM_UTK0003]WKV23362.1 hypothetical protein SEA1_gp0014 [Salmonella phage SEA1]WLI71642.1 hypothetical protein CPTAKMNP4_017 [Salmonella phage vB_SenM-AKM_NP4]AGE48141.1 hypothetical protein [Salmonella phage vB_SenM-S16]